MDATVKLLNLSKLWEYNGQINKNMKYGFGKETWKNDKNQQYEGSYHLNCLHGSGKYTWKSLQCYEGSFYANDIQGYGLMSYGDGSYFEGLFKDNKRFGPGIFTNTDGSQDVGLWIENQLIRLSTNLTDYVVPSLAKSPEAKIYLNKYKKLIIIPKEKTISRIILEQINALDLKKFENALYNNLVKNESSLFFNSSEFDKKSDLNDTSKLSVGSDPFQEKTVEILAWNNEDQLISLMEYIYKYRNSESELSFNVLEILFDRELYGSKGSLEIACEDFFESVINKRNISTKFISNFDLNPDVCDIFGNSVIHCAVSTDNTKELRTLVEFGASLDRLNDECLTPLSICLLRYLEVKENVSNWELAFLPPIITNKENDQTYILDLSCKILKHPEKKKKERKIKEKTGKARKKNKPIIEAVEEKQEEKPNPIEEKILMIKKTMQVLLDLGSDPNIGDVPLPPLFLSLFTLDQEIVSYLIEHGVDCNARNAYQDGFLSPLHVVASMRPSPELPKLAKILLETANPNPRCNETHWSEEKAFLDPTEESFDEGKTPLHLLALRYDFLENKPDHLGAVFDTMVQFGCDPNLLYLEHSCLSLAILRGNLRLMERILKCDFIDPNQCLGTETGSPMTVLILKRYKNVLPLWLCQEVYQLLLQFNGNPFYSAVQNEAINSIEFCEEKNMPEVTAKKGKVNSKKDPHTKVILILYKCAQSVLDRQILAKVVKYIYTYKILCDFFHPIFKEWVKFLDVQETKRILQILINYDHIKVDLERMKSFLTFVEHGNDDKIPPKSKEEKSRFKGRSPKSPKTVETSEDLIKTFVENLKKEPLVEKKLNIPAPEVDLDEKKYQVCYNCFTKEGKTLLLCPICEMVYFCSQECNKNNLKKKTRHHCNNLFYLDELEMVQQGIFRPLVVEELANRKDFVSDIISGLNLSFLVTTPSKISEKRPNSISNSKRSSKNPKNASSIINRSKKKDFSRKPKTV